MVLILSVIGFVLGIYLVVLVRGHLATKKVMAGSKRDGSRAEGQEANNHKNHFEDNSG